jgi:hypothetical protein
LCFSTSPAAECQRRCTHLRCTAPGVSGTPRGGGPAYCAPMPAAPRAGLWVQCSASGIPAQLPPCIIQRAPHFADAHAGAELSGSWGEVASLLRDAAQLLPAPQRALIVRAELGAPSTLHLLESQEVRSPRCRRREGGGPGQAGRQRGRPQRREVPSRPGTHERAARSLAGGRCSGCPRPGAGDGGTGPRRRRRAGAAVPGSHCRRGPAGGQHTRAHLSGRGSSGRPGPARL